MTRITGMQWFGGKYYQMKFLKRLFPVQGVRHFIDLFGGGGTVILNVEPYEVMTYNDINEEVVNFFRVLRDRHDELLPKLALTPYARKSLHEAIHAPHENMDEVERARLFFTRINQSINGFGTHSDRSWSKTNKSNDMQNLYGWLNKPSRLREIVDFLMSMQIECDTFERVIKAYDAPDAFFYADPPYILEERESDGSYEFEMTDEEHELLASCLNGIEGRAAVSGYRCAKYDKWFAGWERIDHNPRHANNFKQRKRVESVWLNYAPETPSAPLAQPDMFPQ